MPQKSHAERRKKLKPGADHRGVCLTEGKFHTVLRVCQSILQEGLDHGADIADRLDHTLAWNSYLDRPLVLYLNLNLILTLEDRSGEGAVTRPLSPLS